MNHLVIFCHPSPSSFNRAIADTVQAVSHALGHDTLLRDLYKMEFDPILRKEEFETPPGTIPRPDVLQEQDFIDWSDVLTFVYPIWWAGMPAMLKGYIERVFCRNFAFAVHGDKVEGLLTGKKVLIFNTTGAPSALYSAQGMHEAMGLTTNTGIFELCGMEVLHHAFFGGLVSSTDETRKSYLAKVEAITSRYL
ncbi:MAG: NAD(P)H-dependent oxidoreductase [Desulfovibrionales bacterium]|nr:NAD(P)H-dependent oxidoreductase [Desulfovibrionales bacterium]